MALPFQTGLPGPQSVFIPSFGGKQTVDLINSFARDPKKFAVNKIAHRAPSQYLAGNFMRLRPEVLARVGTVPNSSVWMDGQDSPDGDWNNQDYQAIPFTCSRVARIARLGDQTMEQAVWPIEQTQLAAIGHQMMTLRSQAFYNVAMDTTKHLSTHVKTATQWSAIGGNTGGFWSAGTETNPIVDRTIKQMAEAIRKSTLDAVSYLNLSLVMTPPIAIAISTAQEIHSYVARSPFALAQIKGDAPNQNYQWGLPEKLYGVNVVIDGTLKCTTGRMVIPGTMVDVMSSDDNTALLMAVPDDLPGNVGQLPSVFSSIVMVVYRGEEMVTTSQHDTWHMRTKMRVHETYGFLMFAPETCSLATNIFS